MVDASTLLHAFGLPHDEECVAVLLDTVGAFARADVREARRTAACSVPTCPATACPATVSSSVTTCPVTTCPGCGAADPSLFDTTTDTAEMVCTRCGAVIVDHMLFQGQAERDFQEEGEDDPAHASFPSRYGYLMSDAYNLQTDIRNGPHGKTARRPVCREEHPYLKRAFTSTRRRDTDMRVAIGKIEAAAQRLAVSSDAQVDAVERFAKRRKHAEHMMSKDVQMAACLMLAAGAHARKPLLSTAKPAATVQCSVCDAMFCSTAQRAEHYAATPACKAATVKRETAIKRRLNSLECNFDTHAFMAT